MRKLVFGAVLTTVIMSAPAYAQSKKELAAQNAALAQRVSVLESRMLTGDPAAERLMQSIDALETAQRNVTGEVERLRYERDQLTSELEALSEDIRAMQDLSTRIRIHLDAVDLVAQETQNSAAVSMYSGDGTSQALSGNDGVTDNTLAGQPSQVPSAPVFRETTIPVQEQYNDAAKLAQIGREKLSEGDFTSAQTAFQQYLTINPDGSDAGEISFWLGQTYYIKGGYADAADSYIASMRKDPKGAKAPDALIRLAASLRELGNQAEACQALTSFNAQFPNATAAQKQKARVETSRTGC